MPVKPPSPAEKLLFGLALAFYAVFVLRAAFHIEGELYFSLFDDAMISMRYARNLAEGHGLLWNPGEPAVEGYTNFLWTLWMAFLHLLPVPESKISLLVVLSSLACLLGNAEVIRRIALAVSGGNRLASFVAVALTLFSYPLMFWSLRGMEVGVLALFLDVAILAVVRLGAGASTRYLALLALVLAASLLTRPDSVVPVGLIIAFATLSVPATDRVRTGLVLAGVAALTVGALTAFRLAYYHDTLPNTYYLKVSGTPLSVRLSVGLTTFTRTAFFEIWPLLVIPVLFALRRRAFLRDPIRLLLTALLFAQCAYSIYVGGDAWEHLRTANRYISIVLPAAFVLTASLLAELLGPDGEVELRSLSRVIAGLSGLALLIVAVSHLVLKDSIFFIWGAWFLIYCLDDLALAVLFGRLALGKTPGIEPGFLRAAAFVLPILIGLNGGALAWWLRYGVDPIDEEMTRLGVAVRGVTQPGARIGVVWAGAPPYFSHLPSVDLLGKSDAFIAKTKSHLPFLPGHTKWDYAYSIPTYHPDLLLQTWRLTAGDRALLTSAGYDRLPNGAFVRRDSKTVDAAKVAALPFSMRNNLEEP